MASYVNFNTLGPFDSILPLNQVNWASYFSPSIPDGVIAGLDDELKVYANSSGMVVYVKSGECRARTHRGVLSALATLDIAASDLTYDRIDLVVARVTYGNPSTMVIAVKTGVPAASPAVPALTQTAGDCWEIPLASVSVASGAVTIAAVDVTDLRFVYQAGGTAVRAFSAATLAVANDYEYRNGIEMDSLEVVLPADDPTGVWMCSICFSSSASFTGLTFSRNGTTYTPKASGDPLTLISKRYSVMLWWDGLDFWSAAKAV